jgi:hypothetical protein
MNGGGGGGGGSDGGDGGGGSDGGDGGGGSDGGGLRTIIITQRIIPVILPCRTPLSWCRHEVEVRVEIGVTHMKVRFPRKQMGDYLAQSRAMHLANVQTFGSQCLASKQSSICATDRFIFVH